MTQKITIQAEQVEIIVEEVYKDMRPRPELAKISDDDLRKMIFDEIKKHPDKYLYLEDGNNKPESWEFWIRGPSHRF
jgi:hypothetical protein